MEENKDDTLNKTAGQDGSGNLSKEPVSEKTPDEVIAEHNDKYLRLYSEFDNFRKRTAKERLELVKFAGEDIFTGLLPIADDFERAVKANETSTDIITVREGIKLIQHKLLGFLRQRGIEEIKTEGEVFNTDLHEAITNIPAPSEDMKGKIIECVEKGYYYNGKVIRYAKVVVGS